MSHKNRRSQTPSPTVVSSPERSCWALLFAVFAFLWRGIQFVFTPAPSVRLFFRCLRLLAVVILLAILAINGIGVVFNHACSVFPFSYHSACASNDTSLAQRAPFGSSAGFQSLSDTRQISYEQGLNASAQGSFLSLEASKTSHLINEMATSLQRCSLSSTTQLDTAFIGEDMDWLSVALHTISSVLENGLLRTIIPPEDKRTSTTLWLWTVILKMMRTPFGGIKGNNGPTADRIPPLDVDRVRKLVDESVLRLKRTQATLRQFHGIALIQDSVEDEKCEKEKHRTWLVRDNTFLRRCIEIRDCFAKTDHQRQEILGQIDGMINSLQFFYPEIAILEGLPDVESRHYQILQLGHSLQKLGTSARAFDVIYPLLGQVMAGVTSQILTALTIVLVLGPYLLCYPHSSQLLSHSLAEFCAKPSLPFISFIAYNTSGAGHDIRRSRNYAHFLDGARVLPEVTSITYRTTSNDWLSKESDLRGHTHRNPPYILSNELFEVGDCWEFSGDQGVLGVFLAEPTSIKSVGIGHVHPDLVSHTSASKSPRKFRLWASHKDQIVIPSNYTSKSAFEFSKKSHFSSSSFIKAGETFVSLLDFEFNPRFESPFQEFPLIHDSWSSDLKFRAVILEVVENWGGERTCLYHFSILN
ncbi:hypothetical protein NP233_g7128 [Leucocoprinus birnbaumii]|uniref:SUN domain-containing protein n=1 Tax=Leucocoprinus birnbaumii TaxID=56174 RepID=A0AAD5VPV6_9AGAR|nr:hypothetical protein NP233_g7128 [Leucocoprinus birnbaumii]